MNPKTIAIAALLAASSAAPAGAQTIVDMSLISCDQFLKSPQERKDVLSAWMGGYYSAMKNLATSTRGTSCATQRRSPSTAERRETRR